MNESINGSSYSAEEMQARKKDLRNRLGSKIEICEPQDAEGVRLIDLGIKITSYRKQYRRTKDPQEKKVILLNKNKRILN